MIAVIIVCAVMAALVLLVVVLPTLRFLRDKRTEQVQWDSFVPHKVTGLGSVGELRILPLVDWYVNGEGLVGEPGVSWLVQADSQRLLMDVGLNLDKEEPSPLVRNMNTLGVSFREYDGLRAGADGP